MPRFNSRRITGFAVEELQADEIRSFAGGKDRITWIFAAIEVWSRLWPSTVVGRRSYRNTLAIVRDVADRMAFEGLPLIVTDGFDFYKKVVRRVFGQAVLYAQVLKTRRNDRVVKVEQRAVHGAAWRFDETLRNSEDSSALNTSFIERLNLTIRQSLAYLATNAFPRSLEGEVRRPPRARSLPLQFRSAAQGVAVLAGDQDDDDAGWTRQAEPDAQGNLRVPVDIRINTNKVRSVRVRWRP